MIKKRCIGGAMKYYLYILLSVTMLLTGCKQSPTTDHQVKDSYNDKSSIDIIEQQNRYPLASFKLIKIDRNKLKEPIKKGNIRTYELKQWFPKPMNRIGKLVKKWSIPTIEDKYGLDYVYVSPLPEGIFIDTNRKSDLDLSTNVINTLNGKQLHKRIDTLWSGYLCANEFIFTSAGDVYPVECLDIKNGNILWTAAKEKEHLIIVDGCLINLFLSTTIDIQRINHQTGEYEWNLFYNDSVVNSAFAYTDKYIYLLNKIYNKDHKFERYIMYKIDPHNGDYKLADLGCYYRKKNNVSSIVFNNNYLWLLTVDGMLLKINPDDLSVISDTEIKEEKLSEVSSIGSMLYIHRDLPERGLLIDANEPKNISKLDLGILSMRVTNGQLIIQDRNSITQITNVNIGAGWYIDKKDLDENNKNNIDILYQDYRGVFVATDKRIYCFGKP